MTGERSGRGVRPGPTVKGTGTMTARQRLSVRIHRLDVASVVPVCFAAIFLAADDWANSGRVSKDPLYFLCISLVILLVYGCGAVYASWAICCPWCHADWTWLNDRLY